MSRKLQKKVVLALDRLNGRRHTFGLLLTSLIDQLADRIGDFAVLRSQSRSDSVTVKAREIILPRWLESHYLYSALIALFLRYHAVDLVHYPFLYAPYAWWGAGCRRVVTIHGAARAMVPDTLVRRFHPLKLQRYRRAMRAFDAVITVSESSKHDIVRHFLVPPEKVHVIYNGVGRQFRPDQDCNPVLLKYGIPGPYVLSVSTIKPKKNVTATVSCNPSCRIN